MAIQEPRTNPQRVRPTLRGTGTRMRQPRPAPPLPTAEPRSWSSRAMALSGLNVLAGIWLIIASWVLGYSRGDPRWNDLVFGIVIALLALVRAAGGVHEQWVSVVNAAVGIWLFVAAVTIDQTATATWNDIILGIVVVALALGSLEAGTPHFGARRGSPPHASRKGRGCTSPATRQ